MEQNKLETTLKQIEEWADKAGFQTSYDKESNIISFEAWNSYDKDIFEEFNFDKDDPMSFMEDLQERIDSYDVSEETSLWLDSQGHGKNGAPYDIEELLESSKEGLRMLQDLYDHIEYKGESRREHFFNPEKAAACYTTLDNYREVSGFLDYMGQITRLKGKPYGHDIGDIFKEAYTNYPLTSHCGKNDMNVIGNWLASVCADNKFDQKEFFTMIEKNISPSVNLEKENGKIQTTSAQTKQKKLDEPSRGR